jgi:predicted dehydrogenase
MGHRVSRLNRLQLAIIGAGRMGRIRANSARAHSRCQVVAVADAISGNAASLAGELGCDWSTDWTTVAFREDVDAVVVATPHKYLSEITTAALRAGKFVFCEKPGARTPAEAESIRTALASAAAADGSLSQQERLVVGFTLRHHPAVNRAHELLLNGEIGESMYVRGRYGHGGRPGYGQEWRGNAELAGGGELLDQGVHLIDLGRWFLGEFEQVSGMLGSYCWGSSDSGPVLEDNAFLLLRTVRGKLASLHASWTQWKNLFSFEVYGEQGSLEISGLGGSYGPERLVISRRRTAGGAPDTHEIPLNSPDSSTVEDVWSREWEAFVSTALGTRASGPDDPCLSSSATALDCWQALRVVEAAYKCSETGVLVRLGQDAAGTVATVS